MVGFLSSPIFQLLLLAALAVVLRRVCLRTGGSPAASGAIVMAGGIAALGALQEVPFSGRETTQLAALVLTLIWISVAGSCASAWARGTFSVYLANPVESFAIGTWIAGTCVLGQIMLLALPGWRSLAVAAWALAIVLWLWFVPIALRGFRAIASDPAGRHVTGRILLSTASTQSLAILSVSLFSTSAPRWTLASLLILGYLFYIVGIVLIAERYLRQRGWRLVDDWDTTNCILHGAMPITGLAALVSGVLSAPWIIGTWIWVAAMFIVVESLELARAWARVRVYGWRRGLLTYDISQWARNFTFGMFYAFSLHLQPSLLGQGALTWFARLRDLIVGGGQYVVIGLLLLEVALFVRGNMRVWTHVRDDGRVAMESGAV